MRHGRVESSPEEFEHLSEDEALILRGLSAPIRDDDCDCEAECLCEEER